MLVLECHDKDTKYSGDKTNIGNPKVYRGCPPLTANRTSTDWDQNSPGPSIQNICLGVYHTGGFNAMRIYDQGVSLSWWILSDILIYLSFIFIDAYTCYSWHHVSTQSWSNCCAKGRSDLWSRDLPWFDEPGWWLCWIHQYFHGRPGFWYGELWWDGRCHGRLVDTAHYVLLFPLIEIIVDNGVLWYICQKSVVQLVMLCNYTNMMVIHIYIYICVCVCVCLCM